MGKSLQKADNVTVEPLGEKNEVSIITKELEYKLELEHMYKKPFPLTFLFKGPDVVLLQLGSKFQLDQTQAEEVSFFFKSNIF